MNHLPPWLWAILAVLGYASSAAFLIIVFCRAARRSSEHLDRWEHPGSHPYMPGGSPAGEDVRP